MSEATPTTTTTPPITIDQALVALEDYDVLLYDLCQYIATLDGITSDRIRSTEGRQEAIDLPGGITVWPTIANGNISFAGSMNAINGFVADRPFCSPHNQPDTSCPTYRAMVLAAARFALLVGGICDELLDALGNDANYLLACEDELIACGLSSGGNEQLGILAAFVEQHRN